jgi:hypothetical protein
MTIFDLVFLLLLLTAIITLIVAVTLGFRGRWARAFSVLQKLGVSAVAYLCIVYIVAALSKQVVLRVGDPQCSDDWCIAVERVKRAPMGAVTMYEVTLKIFSRALRRAQRENIATDVYLVDSEWRRYLPILRGSEIPLNTLLQPGESVMTGRVFEIPADAHNVGLVVGRRALPVCLIIEECGAFHKGTVVRID